MSSSGVTNDFVSGHTTVFAVRKKTKERTKYVYRTLRDLSNFDLNVFKTLLLQEQWNVFDNTEDVDLLWGIFSIKRSMIYYLLCARIRGLDSEKRLHHG